MARFATHSFVSAALCYGTCATFLVNSSSGRTNEQEVPQALASTVATASKGADALVQPMTEAPASEGAQLENLQQRVLELEERIAQLEASLLELTQRLDRILPPEPPLPEAPLSEVAVPESGSDEAPGVQLSESSGQETPSEPAENPTNTPAIAPADPLASPLAIKEALRVAFQREMLKDPSFVLGLNSPDQRAQNEADRVLQSWVRQTEARYRKRITWPIQVEAGQELANGEWAYQIQVLDRSGGPSGAPFTQRMTNRIAQRLEKWRMRTDLSKVLMKGIFEPKLKVIPRRASSSPFNSEILVESKSVLISEWVSFEFSVRLTTIIPIFVDEPTPPKPNQPLQEKEVQDES